MIGYTIRALRSDEFPLLRDFTYEAIFQREGAEPLPRDIILKPEISVFYENFGKPHDHGLVAEWEGKPVGAVWVRIIDGDIKGFGHVDSKTPEFAISILKEHRHKGIGAALMQGMLRLLREQGYRQTSLAVQKDNYALRMYANVGFRIIKELEEEYLMICPLQ